MFRSQQKQCRLKNKLLSKQLPLQNFRFLVEFFLGSEYPFLFECYLEYYNFYYKFLTNLIW
jgi:hypothetical protein